MSFHRYKYLFSHYNLLNLNIKVILSGGTSHTPKIASILEARFPPTTSILSPSTSATSLPPSYVSACGAAIQASLVQEFESEDIAQSTHPMVTVTPHLRFAIGVLLVTEEEHKGVFKPLLEAETAVPARRAGLFAVGREGGDVLVKVCEGRREIRVRKAEAAKDKPNGKVKGEEFGGLDDDSDDDEEREEAEETRDKVWRVGRVLAEAAIRSVSKGSKVEVTVNVSGDLGVQITARESGGKGGVRGVLEVPKTEENGSLG